MGSSVLTDTKSALRGMGPQARDIPLMSLPVGTELSELTDCALYASVTNPRGAPAPVVRLDLVARLKGHAQPLGAVFLPVGFSGLAIVAAGFPADSYAVEGGATSPEIEVTVSMIARDCCGGTGVTIAPELQEWPIAAPAVPLPSLFDPPIAPLGDA